MNKLIGSLLITGLLSGCLVRTHDGRRGNSARRSQSCGPAHHWNGYECVHNGGGRGNGKGRGR
jgi:hypothetical protein